jgi:signal peptidase II
VSKDINLNKEGGRTRTRNAVIFLCVAFVWVVFDQMTKVLFDSEAVGAKIADVLPGILEFRLVHNTGAAWGIFGNSTAALGVFSLVICAVIVLYLFVLAPKTSALGTIGLALIFAGGIGNAIDRFINGYVVDFICTTFIDFPVFNVADVGVTCGVVLFLIAAVTDTVRESK